MEWSLSDCEKYASIAVSVVAIITMIILACQLSLTRRTLKTQVAATESELYVTMNLEFFRIIEKIQEEAHFCEAEPGELDKLTYRAIDIYFYLCNVEYNLISQGTVSTPVFSEHWIAGMQSAASKKDFIDRWHQRASKFTLNPKYKDFFEKAIAKAKESDAKKNGGSLEKKECKS